MEEWRAVPGFPGYEVSDMGRVRSSMLYHGSTEPRLLTPSPATKGYLRVGLSRDGAPRTRMVHRLVLITFVGPRPQGMQTRHLDGDKTNNRLSNLAYGTASENTFDTVRHGTHPSARRTECIHGHEFTPENTYIRRNGSRACKTCTRDRDISRRSARAGRIPAGSNP